MGYKQLERAISECRDRRGGWSQLPFEDIESELAHDYTNSDRLEEFEKEIEYLREFNGRYKKFKTEFEKLKNDIGLTNITEPKLEQKFGSKIIEIVKEGVKASKTLVKLKSYQEKSKKTEEIKVWELIYDVCLNLVGPKVQGLGVKLGNLADKMGDDFEHLSEKYSNKKVVAFVFHEAPYDAIPSLN